MKPESHAPFSPCSPGLPCSCSLPAADKGTGRVARHLQAMAQSTWPLVLQVTHGIGGGVERHVRELYSVLQGRAWVLILRPAPRAGVVRLAFGIDGSADQLEFRLPDDGSLLQQLLLAVGLTRIHIHHVSGFPDALWPLLQDLQRPLDLTLHDYTIIAGSPTLTDRTGCYAGWQADGRHECTHPEQAQRLQMLATVAERCIVPSRDMQQRLAQALPWLQTQARPHPDRECAGPYPPPRMPDLAEGQPLRVMCLGALGREKGVQVLRDVARLARRRGVLLEFSLLGSAHIPLGKAVNELGPYRDEELPALLASHQPHLLWFPVRCPETWSYTLSAALAANVPVLASDLGAFAERLQGRGWSWLRPHDSSTEDWLATLLDIREQGLVAACSGAQPVQAWSQSPVPPFYRAGYLPNTGRPDSAAVLPCVRFWQDRYVAMESTDSTTGWRTMLLNTALRLRRLPLVGRALACIPYNWQRKFKRLLSRAPLH